MELEKKKKNGTHGWWGVANIAHKLAKTQELRNKGVSFNLFLIGILYV